MQAPILHFLKEILKNLPQDWLSLTTHRLDIYKEEDAKTAFLTELEKLYDSQKTETPVLSQLPTAYDYIRLGHPLSSLLEWSIAKTNNLPAAHVVAFSSRVMPILSVLRKNHLESIPTRIAYVENLPFSFDSETIKKVYGYSFNLHPLQKLEELSEFKGSTIFVSSEKEAADIQISHLPNASSIDFYLSVQGALGSVLVANKASEAYVKEIQHVRRRESIAMTPANCHQLLTKMVSMDFPDTKLNEEDNQAQVQQTIQSVTETDTEAVLGSSGLSIQYAIMMGLVEHAQKEHPGKAVRFLIPPNCYGGTNDQARRVAACLQHVEILDLPVDREHNMVNSLDEVLGQVAQEDAVPCIIVEIPTNPRVEVPIVKDLRKVLKKDRKTPEGVAAIPPVFIIDQTFCPNVPFLRKEGAFPDIQTIIYVSGSKFPSGGKCTAGYCTANKPASKLMKPIGKHLQLCDNEATDLQVAILAQQMPSMIQRIHAAYENTRKFVDFIKNQLPSAKINFVSEDLAKEGFTPSVFSLDLPTKGETHQEREAYKHSLNHRLIQMMINEIPGESKYCVSYGQLKGCYWTIPATSTQGTTKEEDKDYIARVALSPNMDLDRHMAVFERFVSSISEA